MRKRCVICGRVENLEVHHLLCGAQRRKADAYGLVVMLCHDCHMQVHGSAEMMRRSRMAGQRLFERKHSREEFIRIFGRSYL